MAALLDTYLNPQIDVPLGPIRRPKILRSETTNGLRVSIEAPKRMEDL